MTRAALLIWTLALGSTGTQAQVVAPRSTISATRLPTVSPELLKQVADGKLRSDLDAATAQIKQLQATVAKMQQQVDAALGIAAQARFDLDKVAKAYLAHVHVVNGTVGSGLSSTLDGNKQVFRYVMPPHTSDADLKLRTTGAPTQP